MKAVQLVAMAALCQAVAAGGTTNKDGVVVMGMGTRVRYEHREVVYQNKIGSEPMGGNIWPVAIYWVEIEVGTPPRKFPVAVDTGSFTLDIPDVNCTSCIHTVPNNVYDAKSSSTSEPVHCGFGCDAILGQCREGECGFSNTYETCDLKNPTAPCTITGRWYKDEVRLGGATGSTPIHFGTITFQTKNFDQFKNIDGVMGLAGPADSKNTFNSLVNAGKYPKNVFAMCFVKGKTSNGTITFGGTDPRLYTSQTITYVPNTGGLMYSVELKSIAVAGAKAPETASNSAILDSGTNILLLPTVMFKAVRKAFENLCQSTKLPGVCDTQKSLFDKYCYDFTPAQLSMFPPMTLALDGIDLHMQPRNYLLQGEPGQDATVYCLGIRDTGANGLLIIGDSTMENYYMVMDRTNKRIGWAPVNRTSCGSIGSF